MRYSFTLLALALASCSAPPPAPKKAADPTTESAYTGAVTALEQLNREAAAELAKGRRPEAGALIERGEAPAKTLLAAPHPSLAALQAVSDRDQMYAEMLMANRHWTHARQMLLKNALRWRHWQPQTPDSERRRLAAEQAIAECDRNLR